MLIALAIFLSSSFVHSRLLITCFIVVVHQLPSRPNSSSSSSRFRGNLPKNHCAHKFLWFLPFSLSAPCVSLVSEVCILLEYLSSVFVHSSKRCLLDGFVSMSCDFCHSLIISSSLSPSPPPSISSSLSNRCRRFDASISLLYVQGSIWHRMLRRRTCLEAHFPNSAHISSFMNAMAWFRIRTESGVMWIPYSHRGLGWNAIHTLY